MNKFKSPARLVELFTEFCFGSFDNTEEGLLKTKKWFIIQVQCNILTFHYRPYVCNALYAIGYFSRSHIKKVSVEFEKAP